MLSNGQHKSAEEVLLQLRSSRTHSVNHLGVQKDMAQAQWAQHSQVERTDYEVVLGSL